MTVAVGLGLLACLASVAPAASASAGQESVGTEGMPSETVRAANPWTDLLDRDATLTFRRNAVDSAVEDLREGGLDLYGRSSAWFMLGLGNALERRQSVTEALTSTAGIEKLAVILALGEFDPAPVAVLEALVLDPSSEVRSAALLALLRSGDDAAIARLGQFAAAGGPLGREITQLARFAKERETSDPSIAGALWLDLRYRAAVRYGLIDGQSYRILELERLGGDSDFLDAAVLPLAAESRWLQTRDHLMALLVESPGPAVFEAALSSIPAEIGLVVRNGIWQPADEEEWAELVAAIRRTGSRLEVIDVLDKALGIESIRREAAIELLSAGDRRGWELVSEDLVEGDPEARAEVARALGRSGDPDWLLELQRLATDESPRVRAAGLAGRVRLGELKAFETCVRMLANEQETERESLTVALLSEAADVRVQTLLEQSLLVVEGELNVRVAIALALEQRSSARVIVREALAERTYPDLTADLVRALGAFADASDVERFRRLFPSGGDTRLDLELARALIQNRDALGTRIVRAAIWQRPWHESVLASCLLADVESLAALHSELESPPPLASRSDMRRLGFAIGLLGGIEEVENMALRRNSGDPALQGAYLGALAARTY